MDYEIGIPWGKQLDKNSVNNEKIWKIGIRKWLLNFTYRLNVFFEKKDVIWRTLFKFGKWKFTSYTLWIIVLKTKSKVIQINGFIYSGTPCIKIYLKLYFLFKELKDVSILYFGFYLFYHACIAFLVEFVLRIRLQLTKLERVAAPAPYITQVIFLKVAC